MPITIGTTFWQCSECKQTLQIDGTELSHIGVPFCVQCEDEQEMEPEDDPVPTVLLIDGDFLGIALRPKRISFNKFEAKVVNLWKAWDKLKSEKSFAEWAEDEHDILFLTSDYIINPKLH